jgi:phytoene synthase
VTAAGALDAAYAHCEAVTRTEAANFYYGIRLLPRGRRRAICAVYAFARRVDDIGDGPLERAEKLRLLDAEASALAAVEAAAVEAGAPGAAVPAGPARPGASAGGGYAGDDLVMVALADAYRSFALPHGALGELIEGVRMDVNGEAYEAFDELVLYCRRVAGAIGRVCLAIFGLRAGAAGDRPAAERLADELGVAMQLTNILRDLREDAENGRVYLPAEDLRRFGVLVGGRADPSGAAAGRPAQVLAVVTADGGGPDARLAELVRFEARRAREWFERGIVLTRLLDRRSAASVLAMAGIYRRLLDRIEAQPEAAARRRVSLPAREKALVAARVMLGGRA